MDEPNFNFVFFGSVLICTGLTYFLFTFTEAGDIFVAQRGESSRTPADNDGMPQPDPAPRPQEPESWWVRIKRRATRFFTRFNLSMWFEWLKDRLQEFAEHAAATDFHPNVINFDRGWNSTHSDNLHRDRMRSDQSIHNIRNTFVRYYGPY